MQHIEQDKLQVTTQLRFESFLLADQLRQSPDDLTRMVRTYVETGDSKFEDYFWDIKAIRDGIKPRPLNYERIYWDFMTVNQPAPPFKGGETVSLEALMKDAGFTEKEFHLLDNAKNRSDKLINMERIAMHAMKGKFQDKNGEFTISGEVDPEMARQLVFGYEYHEAKKGIMGPINEFLKAIDQRTLQNVDNSNLQVRFHQRVSVFIFSALIFTGLLLLLTTKRHQYLLIGELKTAINKQEDELTERIHAEKEVKHQLLEKEIILKEVHHRIKNNFSSIESILSLQADSIINPEAISILKDAIGRVNSMQILYEKLLLNDNYSITSVKDYLNNLISEIFNLFSGEIDVTLEKHISDFQFDPKRMVTVGIIVNELLTNVMKYAFKSTDSYLVKITLIENNGNVTLSIQDNGKGLPAGFDINKQEGFGIMLVKMLSEQLHGSFTIENNNGTLSILRFNI